MKYTYKTFLLILSFFLVASFGLKAQTLTSITPNAALPNTNLTTTITGEGIAFAPGSPFGGSDLRMEQNGGGYIINSNDGSVSLIDDFTITADWLIPLDAPPGFYDVQADVDDGTGTGTTITLTLASGFQVYPLVTLSQTHVNTTCGNSNGSVTLTVNTGASPYTYNWSNGATTQNLSGLSQGGYSVTVTDVNNTTGLLNVNIGNTNGPTVTLASSVKAICTSATGALNVSVTGGTSPYTYIWTNSATTKNITNIATGSYSLTVTDNNNCDNFLTAAVGDTNALNITYAIHKPTCGNNTGSITAQGNGQSPYLYNWSTGSTNATATGLSSGVYTVMVTDAHGCVQQQTINASVSFNYYVYLTTTPSNCKANGSVTSQVYGGTPPYTYLWSNSATTADITGLSVQGNYVVTVTDSLGCTKQGSGYLYVSCNDIIAGTLFSDSNNNCIVDVGDKLLSGYSVRATGSNGSAYYGYSDSKGNYVISVPGNGTYTVAVSSNYNACTSQQFTSCGSNTVTLSVLGDTSYNNNFVSNMPSGSFDLSLHPGWLPAKPGFVKQYWIYYYNSTPEPYTGPVTLIFNYDSHLKFIDSIAPHPVSDTSARTLTWTVTGAPVGLSYNGRVAFYMRVDPLTPLNYQLQNTFTILPKAGDCDSLDNVMFLPDLVSGSRDPNEKDVSPAGIVGDADSILTYTIHFQNNGTDTTSFVMVKDTLSPYVDPGTVVNIASNPQYSEFSISGKGILRWVFNPAYLPDSATNADESKGFIRFSIKRRDSIPTGTEISNKAYIYFDYNGAVITNTVKDTVLSSIATTTKSVTGSSVSVNAYPNPFAESTNFIVNGISGNYDFALTNVLGQTMTTLNQVSSGHFTLKRNELAAGIYFYSIKVKGKEVASGKLVVANE